MSLTSDQVEAYLERCSVPEATRAELRKGPDSGRALEAVTTLQQCHMAAIPFENLSLHYSEHKTMPQDTRSVFEHVVLRRRGGTCIQVNLLFAELLRVLGFEVMCTGGRLNVAASIAADERTDRQKVAYGPWVHVNTIVTIGDDRYMVDTNFNQFGSPFPVRLAHNQPEKDVSSRQRRMIHDTVPGLGSRGKWWRMQLRDAPQQPWMDVYCFREVEWLPIDFEIMTAGLDQLGAGWFRSLVVCFRILLDEEDASRRPAGWVMVYGDHLKRCWHGRVEVAQRFYCEADRVMALEDNFGVVLTDDEQKQIIGSRTELVDEGFDFYG